jgi:methionyl-tRNA formyltransferase
VRVVFLGTPEFAVPSLEAVAKQHEVAAVFTQPDRPKGRAQQLAQSAVKMAALELGIPVHQPERVRRPESFALLQSLAADIMIVVGYGQIIPQSIIDLPRFGILNVHASLLPKYRGAAPIQWAIANGESETGVTIMQIDAGLDTGDMLLKGSLSIAPDETAPELSARLAPLGAELLLEAVAQIGAGTARTEKQDSTQATLARILIKEDGQVNWSEPAARIYNRYRGFYPWPGSYTTFRGQQLTLTAMRTADGGRDVTPGRLLQERRRLLVACGEGSALELMEVQLAGKKRMAAEAFLNGYKLEADETFGEQI